MYSTMAVKLLIVRSDPGFSARWDTGLRASGLGMQPSNGLFPLTESDSDSDSKPYRYIVLCSFSTAWTQIGDSDPFPEWLLYPF